MLYIQTKLKYAILFAISFALLTGMAFLAGLALSIMFAPPPIAQALTDLYAFAPLFTITALIASFIEVFLNLWLALHHRKVLWPVVVVLSLLFGAGGIIFSLFTGIIIFIANLAFTLVMVRLLELRQLKAKENGAS